MNSVTWLVLICNLALGTCTDFPVCQNGAVDEFTHYGTSISLLFDSGRSSTFQCQCLIYQAYGGQAPLHPLLNVDLHDWSCAVRDRCARASINYTICTAPSNCDQMFFREPRLDFYFNHHYSLKEPSWAKKALYHTFDFAYTFRYEPPGYIGKITMLSLPMDHISVKCSENLSATQAPYTPPDTPSDHVNTSRVAASSSTSNHAATYVVSLLIVSVLLVCICVVGVIIYVRYKSNTRNNRNTRHIGAQVREPVRYMPRATALHNPCAAAVIISPPGYSEKDYKTVDAPPAYSTIMNDESHRNDATAIHSHPKEDMLTLDPTQLDIPTYQGSMSKQNIQ